MAINLVVLAIAFGIDKVTGTPFGFSYISSYTTCLLRSHCRWNSSSLDFLALMSDLVDIVLTEADIPGASLKEPLEVHNVAALKWWLLCRGVQVPSSCKKPDLIER